MNNKYEPIVGMEVHAQLATRTKLFCSCPIDWEAEPNTLTCPTCLGMPGTLPVLNKRAVELAIKAALALNCKINEYSLFARKNYFYPDLPKGYQITQYKNPLAVSGKIKIDNKEIRIRRVHLEEDAGKLIHTEDRTLVDFNRCGVPLIEIVTEPDIHSAREAYLYLSKLRQILRYIAISSADMEKGELRCEPNISVKRIGKKKFGTRTEIKNLNSLKAVESGINYEIQRQTKIIESGGVIKQATLLWNEKKKRTEEIRGKETEEDYRYFEEPDLPPLIIEREWIEEIEKGIGELPARRKERFIRDYTLTDQMAAVLTEKKSLADYFEGVMQFMPDSKLISGFITVELMGFLNEKGLRNIPFKPSLLAELISLVKDGIITRTVARSILPLMLNGKSPQEIIREEKLEQIGNREEIEKIVIEVLNEHPQEVKKYKSGKIGLITYFIGQVMRKTRGKANPKLVRELFEKNLNT
jgi:aspartyl-tRNA(Asn)/glutamyl-tRNA(Gln) amidotransferase subunit B